MTRVYTWRDPKVNSFGIQSTRISSQALRSARWVRTFAQLVQHRRRVDFIRTLERQSIAAGHPLSSGEEGCGGDPLTKDERVATAKRLQPRRKSRGLEQ